MLLLNRNCDFGAFLTLFIVECIIKLIASFVCAFGRIHGEMQKTIFFISIKGQLNLVRIKVTFCKFIFSIAFPLCKNKLSCVIDVHNYHIYSAVVNIIRVFYSI